MRRILIIVYSAFLLILLVNFFYYNTLYKNQISYVSELLDQQAQIVGITVEKVDGTFASDLNKTIIDPKPTLFFSDKRMEDRVQIIEKMKIFFSKYEDFVTEIRFNDRKLNEFTLTKQNEKDENKFLETPTVLQVQGKIYDRETIIKYNDKYAFILPVLNEEGDVISNIVATVDYEKYFNSIFSSYFIIGEQWQWVISDSSEMVFRNNPDITQYSQLDKITSEVQGQHNGNLKHYATIKGTKKEILSSYFTATLLGRNLGLVFSAKTETFQKGIIRNSLLIVGFTLLLIQLIIMVFLKYFKKQSTEMSRLNSSEKMLFKLIEEMPVGVIIHNNNREIIKANKVAANQYSYKDESEMQGKIFPETSLPDRSDYFSKNLGGTFNPDQFVIIKKEIGEIVLYRNCIPVTFMNEEASMEILIDVTMLESARKQEAKANVAKTEFLARMSYEIRTPLNGIIGMTDVLNKFDLSPEVTEILSLLRRSTEVLLNIINDILDFSRIESGKMILDELPFNIREEISYCINLAKTNIEGSNPELTCIIEDNIPESIIGDPFRIRQVLTYLLNHSIKNTLNGQIRLRCFVKNIKDGVLTLGFELSDTGQSFDKATLKKIFGEFVNVENKAVKINDDSGFGTILARQLIELMGGELTADSPGGIILETGTRISFSIVTYSNDRIIKNLITDGITKIADIRTLVITGIQNRDEEILGALHKMGLTVTITTFTRATVNQIRANMNFPEDKYKLVILFDDGDFDGFEAARAIWENKLSANFIMIMISSNEKKGNYLNCVTMGIDHYIVKPFDISELIEFIKNSFPFIEDKGKSVDIRTVRTDVKILIVEDNKMNQKVIGTMLNNLGYSYDIAEDGYAGYIQAKIKKYDLVFMDLIMPEMDGFESARKILSWDKTIIIVAFSADNMPESKRKAELSGIRDFISKPVRIDELKRLFAKYFKK
jgi:signal transduction histidine kinase/CheY-like chemotaxis protein